MRKLLESAAQRAIGYLEELDSRGVAPGAEAVAGLDRFREPLPDDLYDGFFLARIGRQR